MRTGWVCFELLSAEVSNRIKSKSEWNKKLNKSVRVDGIYELIEQKYIVIAVFGTASSVFSTFFSIGSAFWLVLFSAVAILF